MINVELKKAPSAFLLTVSGHAGYACKGRDIVCAGVSSLCQAFLSSVKKLYEKGCFRGFSFEVSDGSLSLKATGFKDERTSNYTDAYTLLFIDGIRAIEEVYGEYVRLILCSESPDGEFTDIDTSEKTVNVKGR